MNMRSAELARERHAYLIRNSRLDPDWASVDRRFLTISGRAIATMIHFIGYSDVLRIYAMAKRDGIESLVPRLARAAISAEIFSD